MHPILDSIKPVIKYSEFVRTNEETIVELAPDLAKNDFPKQDLSDEIFVSGLSPRPAW